MNALLDLTADQLLATTRSVRKRLDTSRPVPRDVIEGRPMQRKLFCRTFSDCTTAPRNGMVSGCYPLDEFYKAREEYGLLMELKGEK